MGRGFLNLTVLLCLLFASLNNDVNAAVTITPASGSCLNNSPGAFAAIGTITITEGNNADFSVQAGATFVLSAPAGFEFQAGTGTVTVQAGRNLSAASVVVTATTITVTYTCSAVNRTDILNINGILARGLTAGSSGNILRTAGTANITGDNVANGINHGTLTSDGTGILVSSIADGNWSSGSTWSTGTVPVCNQDIVVSHNVIADVVTSNPNVTINSGGHITADFALTVTGSFTISGTGTYTHNNAGNAATTIFAGTESFSSTSNLIFNQWYNLNIPLGSLVAGSFGNITFNAAGTWHQDGYFAPARVLGNIIINQGTVVMDDGTGMTTSLTLQDVTVNGTGNITVCSGTNRNFAFTTNNFADLSTGSTLSSIMYSCTGTFSWNANGNVSLNDNFSVLESCGSPASASVNITGDLNITSGAVYILKATNTPLTLSVGGNTIISGATTTFTLVNSGSGALNFNSGSVEVSGGSSYEFISGTFSGTTQITTVGAFEIADANTDVYILNITGYSQTVNFDVGTDILIADGQLSVANTSGPVDVNSGRNVTITGSTGLFKLQQRTANAELISLNVSGTLWVTDGTYYHSNGEGNIVVTLGESMIIENGTFTGIMHTVAPSAATADFTFQDFIFNGGIVKFFSVKTSANTTVTINCINNFDITWQSNTDVVELVSYDGNNDAFLNLYVGGNFTVNGNYADAYFLSSKAGGDETVQIDGNFAVGGGNVFFVCDNTSTSGVDAHNISLTIQYDLLISGGVTFLSTRDGVADVNVGGNVDISGGILNLKWLKGIATMNIDGEYIQTGGTFNIHSHTAATTDTCKVVVNGDFTQTGGIFNFDNDAGTGMAEHTLTLNGDNFTVDGSGVITHVNNLSTSYVFGQMYFNRPGTITYARNSSTHNIQHVRQTIRTGTTVDASASTFGFQMTSVASATAATHNALTIDGTLDMGDKILSARQYTNYYSRLSVSSGGRYRTSHTGGLYSGSSSTASSIDGYILTLNRVNYYLDAASTVEYYGTSTSVVTGTPNGIANTSDQQYGILEINFTGTAGSTWVYPETTNEVNIRTTLILTEGEFNLDSDHITSGGGRAINLLSGATTSRSNGFIRSETEDGTAIVNWNITTNSTNIIPFGYDVSNYIPFTFEQTSGSAGTVSVGTYRTAVDNTPYPPTVTHVRDVNGLENSGETVDRFWNITVPGITNANLTFTYAALEGIGIVSPRAQQWEPVSRGWFPPAGIQSNPGAYATTASGITSFNTWWTLSSLGSPLPIELLSFDVKKNGDKIDIDWVTQTEINNDFFTVERSSDGTNFEALRTVDGAGMSTSPLAYSIKDESPLSGKNYYRLKQTDFDGNFTYSMIRFVTVEKKAAIKVYPSPVNSGESLNIEIPFEGAYHFIITDSQGKLIYNSVHEVENKETVIINTNDFSKVPGIYFLQLRNVDNTWTQKIIVAK